MFNFQLLLSLGIIALLIFIKYVDYRYSKIIFSIIILESISNFLVFQNKIEGYLSFSIIVFTSILFFMEVNDNKESHD